MVAPPPSEIYLFKEYASQGNEDVVLIRGGSNNP